MLRAEHLAKLLVSITLRTWRRIAAASFLQSQQNDNLQSHIETQSLVLFFFILLPSN